MFRRFDRAIVPPAVVAGVLLALGHALFAAPQAGLPSGRDIVARHLQAIGGKAAFTAVRSIHAKGTLSMTAQQISGELEVFSERPNRQLIRIVIAGIGRTETGYDGTHGWSIDPVTGATLLSGRQLEELADDAWFDNPLYLPERVKAIETVGVEDFDLRKAHRVKVTMASGSEQFELFDVETGLQIGSESRRETQLGVLPTRSVLRDYRPFGALRLPTTLVQSALGIEQVVQVASYEFNTVPAGTFTIPPQIKALIKRDLP